MREYQRQIDIPIMHDGMVFEEGLHLTVLVEKLVIKAVDDIKSFIYNLSGFVASLNSY